MPQCSMCAFATELADRLVTHVVRNHKHDPHFQVQRTAEGCGATYNKWHSFKQHLLRKHPANVPNELENDPFNRLREEGENLRDANMDLDDGDPDHDGDLDGDPDHDGNVPADVPIAGDGHAGDQLKWHAAKFLVNLRESKRISQRALGYMTIGTDDLMRIKLNELLVQCRRAADPETNAVPMDRIADFIQQSQSSSLFKGVSTEHLLKSYLQNQCGLTQPEKIVLGRMTRWSKASPPRVEEYDAYAYVVPFMKSLEELLNNKQVMDCIENPEVNNSEFIRDFTDGKYFKSLPVFVSRRIELFVIFYYDDVMLTNPLGTKSHKVTLFYWVLLNIHPQLRSTLKAINLLAICKSSYVKKFGLQNVLANFISDIKVLQSEDGYVFNINGVPKRFRETLFFTCADTPAAQYLGGFKEGVGGARLPCRNCLVTKDELSSKFCESDVVLRTIEMHKEHLSLVCHPDLSKQAKNYWSLWYGVNDESAFGDLELFDVTCCLLQDFMHVVPHGVLPAELLNVIAFCVNNGLFDLKTFNDAVDPFAYGHLSRDKPAPVEDNHLNTHLHQSAAQSLTLGHVLPFILAELVEEYPLELQIRITNLIRLLQIINLCMSYEYKEEDVALLSHMIKVHHMCYKMLYPERALTPKFHYMLHFPSQMLNFGPLRHSWCFRFEGLHAYFKSLIPVIRNFKNIEFSLMSRYLKLRWADLSSVPGQPTPNYLYSGDEVKKGKIVTVNDLPYRDILRDVLALPVEANVMKSPEVCSYGTTYSCGRVILLQCLEDDLPKFGQIFEIIVFRETKILLYKKLITEYYDKNLNAYRVSHSENEGAINLTDVIFKHPLANWAVTDKGEYIVLLNHRRVEFMG